MGGLHEIIITNVPRIKSGTLDVFNVVSVSSNMKKKKTRLLNQIKM